jgi:hypothetical protein
MHSIQPLIPAKAGIQIHSESQAGLSWTLAVAGASGREMHRHRGAPIHA